MAYRMLLVDDDPEDLQEYAAEFRRVGHTVLEATSGEEGWRLLKREQPDVIISAFPMPLDDGRLLEEVAARPGPDRPVVIAHTSWVSPRTCARALHIGCDFFYEKPTPAETMLKAIDLMRTDRVSVVAD